ncbi:haloacid dehalogenase-like hydrolase [Streptomyces sp. NPDC085944]|uniref:HAD family hydrolase n=1 Tax=Streptomyces sp. NPDC085944 TaxID=3154962 RepID=UPI003435E402
MSTVRRLVLWDIDYTLLDATGATPAAFRAAFADLFGRPMTTFVTMRGRTELRVVPEVLRLNGVADDPCGVAAFLRALRGQSPDIMAHARRTGQPLPGAREVLALLAGYRQVVCAVVTGNIQSSAHAKLAAFHLDETLDLSVSAFGEEHEDRGHLVRTAVRRAAARYAADAWATPVVVGDTPHDMLAAREAGAVAVGVASGAHSRVRLLAAGADLCLDTLEDAAPLMRLVTSTEPPPT